MEECPNCGGDLSGPLRRESTDTRTSPGGKSPPSELVTCPDCNEVVDGFSPH
jgi:hypothetical protein